jgi:hypothetical protein
MPVDSSRLVYAYETALQVAAVVLACSYKTSVVPTPAERTELELEQHREGRSKADLTGKIVSAVRWTPAPCMHAEHPWRVDSR